MRAPVTVAGRYELGPRVGRGGMADVHKAWDRVLERTVAVKLLRQTLTEEGDHERFRAEAKMLARLDHPGLVAIYDTGLHEDQPFLVMELVEGTTLATLLAERPLSTVESVSIAAALADVLQYVHGRGITHRDIKPSNVLIDRENHVLLADFGVARSGASTQTAPGTLIGTAAYLSPEQVRAEESTRASDIYALGLVLIESLSGKRVYTGTPDVAALARLLNPPPVDDVPEPLRALVSAMTATAPEERPGAAGVTTALHGFLGLVTDSETARLALPMARPAVPTPAPTPVPTAVPGPGSIPVPPEPRPASGAPAGPHRRGGPRVAVLAGAAAGLLVVLICGLVLLRTDPAAGPVPRAETPLVPTASATAVPRDPAPIVLPDAGRSAENRKADARRTTSARPDDRAPAAPASTEMTWAELIALLEASQREPSAPAPSETPQPPATASPTPTGGDDGGTGNGDGPGRGEGGGRGPGAKG